MVYRIGSERQTVLEILGGSPQIVYALSDFQDFKEKFAGVQQTALGRYSDQAMVQLFTLELQKKRIDIPCASDSGGTCVSSDSDECNSQLCAEVESPVESLFDFSVVASASVVENANDQDPRELSRNPEFEAAIMDLYNSVKGILSSPIPVYGFSLRILEQR